jgi:hypothetical protein
MFKKMSNITKFFSIFLLFTTFLVNFNLSVNAQYNSGNATLGSITISGTKGNKIVVNNPLSGVKKFVFNLKNNVNGVISYSLSTGNNVGSCGSIPGDPILVIKFDYKSIQKPDIEIEIDYTPSVTKKDILNAGYCNSSFQPTDVFFKGGNLYNSIIPAAEIFAVYKKTRFLDTIRTGAGSAIRNNLVLVIIITTLTVSTSLSLLKKTRNDVKIER